MHRTRIFHGMHRFRLRVRMEIPFRIAIELRPATGRAKVIALSLISGFAGRVLGIHTHATYRIQRPSAILNNWKHSELIPGSPGPQKPEPRPEGSATNIVLLCNL